MIIVAVGVVIIVLKAVPGFERPVCVLPDAMTINDQRNLNMLCWLTTTSAALAILVDVIYATSVDPSGGDLPS